MKVLQINTVCGTGSTGRIAVDIYNVLKENGHECKIAYGRGETKGIPTEDAIKIGSKAGVYIHALLSRLTDKTGFFSKFATKRFIKQIEEYNPDVIHLHNIHGYYINVEVLFNYLAKLNKKVIWTLHDCWSFTGHCAYFQFPKCEAWKTECRKCMQLSEYPKSFYNNCNKNFHRKRKLFTSVEDMTIAVPSKWLAETVKQSFLGKYPIAVINNGVDKDSFKPVKSDFKQKYGLENKKMVLAVANIWTERKGLLELEALNEMLDDNYKLVMVGKLNTSISSDIIHIERTDSKEELAKIYSAADVFVIPSLEDNFPTVNIEALSCGTPVISYNTGGSPEIADETCGITVENNPKEMANAIVNLDSYGFKTENCIKRAQYFDKNKRFSEYLELYNK